MNVTAVAGVFKTVVVVAVTIAAVMAAKVKHLFEKMCIRDRSLPRL